MPFKRAQIFSLGIISFVLLVLFFFLRVKGLRPNEATGETIAIGGERQRNLAMIAGSSLLFSDPFLWPGRAFRGADPQSNLGRGSSASTG